MKLHENKELFIQAVRVTAQQKGLLNIYVEKDYWVTLVLHTIFHGSQNKDAIFKGGTSLSKCYNLIDRFSEDIDLVLLRSSDENPNQLKRKLKRITQLVSEAIPEIEIEGITHKTGMLRKTAHDYQKAFNGDFGQVRDNIIIEATWLGYFEPFTTRKVSSFIYEMMKGNGQLELAREYGLLPFEVRVLEVKRTLCEKIMSLVRFSYTEQPIDDLKNKIRHIYDINQLLKDEELENFFESSSFDEMLIAVAKDDVLSFKNNNDWLKYHPKEAIIFSNIEEVWKEIRSAYFGAFKELVYGVLPPEKEVFTSLLMVKKRIENIGWAIEI